MKEYKIHEHHEEAAQHYEQAAKHHREAAKHHKAGDSGCASCQDCVRSLPGSG